LTTDSGTAGAYEFDAFCLDLAAGELRRDGVRIVLAPKIFDLLVYLVRNEGRLVTREELLDAVWPDVLVNDGSLTRAVFHLRKALGEDARSPAYVLTVARRGIRFVAAVRPMPVTPRPSPYFLVGSEGKISRLRFGENTLGRGDDVTIPVPAAAASRRHAVITVDREEVAIRDLGSKNGTYVNEVRLQELTVLCERDVVRIGPIPMQLLRDGSSSTITHIHQAPA
jgi:DNA-binding winged helix-turn-helix (wHTH) protein